MTAPPLSTKGLDTTFRTFVKLSAPSIHMDNVERIAAVVDELTGVGSANAARLIDALERFLSGSVTTLDEALGVSPEVRDQWARQRRDTLLCRALRGLSVDAAMRELEAFRGRPRNLRSADFSARWRLLREAQEITPLPTSRSQIAAIRRRSGLTVDRRPDGSVR